MEQNAMWCISMYLIRILDRIEAFILRRLRDSQQQDIRGVVMPEGVASGQVVWYEMESGSLIGRAEVVNIEAGVSSSFSCPGVCQCGLVWYSGSMNPSSGTAVVGDSGFMFAPRETK